MPLLSVLLSIDFLVFLTALVVCDFFLFHVEESVGCLLIDLSSHF